MWNSKLVKKLWWVLFFSFSPCPFWVCSLLPIPARAGSSIPRHWTLFLQNLSSALLRKTRKTWDKTTPWSQHLLPTASRRLCRCGGTAATPAQGKPGQGLVTELAWELWGFLLTSDQTQTPNPELWWPQPSPSPREVPPLDTAAISAPGLSPCPLWHAATAAGSWQWHTALILLGSAFAVQKCLTGRFVLHNKGRQLPPEDQSGVWGEHGLLGSH